jgi:beta-glucosidase
VVSDCGAVADVFRWHKYRATPEEGVAAVFNAGMDVICGDYRNNMNTEQSPIVNAVHQGLMTEAVVDTALRRLFTARFRLGMFDPAANVPYSKISPAENDTAAHSELALQMAREAIVLLKNKDGMLPLKKTPASIAVIGPNADDLDALEGNYNGTPSKPVTVLAGIRERFAQSKVTYVQGTGLVGPVTHSIPSSALCVDAACSEHGLKGEYFTNMNLEGLPVMNRTDAAVDFAWGDGGLSAQFPNHYSVRWTGMLVPPETGDYLVGFTGQDGWRLWVDGNPMAEDWSIHHPASTLTKKIHLEKNHPYAIKIEYFQDMRSSEARLIWSLPDGEAGTAVQAARAADLVIMVLGLSPRIEGEEMKVDADGFAGGDRTKIDLPAPQEQLLERVCETGRPVVLVLMNGSALSVNWASANVPAILEAWYPGGQGGKAVAEALAGDFSPAGRLPVTFYKSVEQLPDFENYSMAKRTYRYFDGEPLYPFGFGLSYTTFAYDKAHVDRAIISGKEPVAISVEVKNTGTIASDEVVQLYLTHPGVAGAPLRALKGFQRVSIAAGKTKTVTFVLRERELSVVDEAGKHRLIPGKVTAWIGGGQPIAAAGAAKLGGAATEFTITGEATLPD